MPFFTTRGQQEVYITYSYIAFYCDFSVDLCCAIVYTSRTLNVLFFTVAKKLFAITRAKTSYYTHGVKRNPDSEFS